MILIKPNSRWFTHYPHKGGAKKEEDFKVPPWGDLGGKKYEIIEPA
jgi:hypothetical protein